MTDVTLIMPDGEERWAQLPQVPATGDVLVFEGASHRVINVIYNLTTRTQLAIDGGRTEKFLKTYRVSVYL